jgi:hypothetical protein
VVQPAVAREAARRGDAGPDSRPRQPLRLRRLVVRPRRRGGDRRLRARLSRERGSLPEEAEGSPGAGGRIGARRRRATARRAARERATSAPGRRALGLASSAGSRRGGDRASAARVRRAPRASARAGAHDRSARAVVRRALRTASRAAQRLPVGSTVLADAGPGARDRGDRRRPRSRDTDAPAASRRRRLGKDGCRPLRPPARRRDRSASRADGADGDACGAALPDDRRAVRRARDQGVPADELSPRARARRRPPADRVRRCPTRGGHARADPEGGRLPRSRGGRRRRAAPLRGRAAQRARRGP